METFGLFAAVIFLAGYTAPAGADELKPEQFYKKLPLSMMALTVREGDGTTAAGTGFLAVEEGRVVRPAE